MNSPLPEPLRIGWNLLSVRRDIVGGWNYVRGVVSAAAAHAPNATFVALVTPDSLPIVEDLKGVIPEVHRFSNRIRPLRVIAEHALAARFAEQRKLNVLHCFGGTVPRGINAPVVLTVYDLLVFSQPSALPWLRRAYLRSEVPRSIRRADILVPISASTGDDIRARFTIPTERIHSLPPVLAEQWNRAGEGAIGELRGRLALPPRYWLYVANGYAHKNHIRALEALARIRYAGDSPWPLILRGANLEHVFARAAELGVADLVRSVPPLSLADMAALTSGASGCLFPSLFEGAGIPVLEAIACGVPLVASDIATNREFAADYARLVPPDDAGALASAIMAVQSEPEDPDELARRAATIIARFRPAAMSSRLMRAYEAAMLVHEARLGS